MPLPSWPAPPPKRRGRLLLKVLAGLVAVVLAGFAALIVLGLLARNRDGNHRYAVPQNVCALIPLSKLDGWAGTARDGKATASGPRGCEYQLTGTGVTPNRLVLTVEVGDRVKDGFRATQTAMKAMPAGEFHDVPALGTQAYTHALVTGHAIVQTLSLLDGNLVLTARFTGSSDRDWATADVESHLVDTLRGSLAAMPRAPEELTEGTATGSASASVGGPGSPYDPSDPCTLVIETDVRSWLGKVASSIPKTASQVAPPAAGCAVMTAGLGGGGGVGPVVGYQYVVGAEAASWYDRAAGRWTAIGKPVTGLGDQALTYEVPGYRPEVVMMTVFVRDGNRAIELSVSADEPKLSREAARDHLIALARTMLTRLPRG